MEQWKDVVGYEGLYQVSNLGRVKSIKFNKENILKQRIRKDGYCVIDLYKNSVRKGFSIHRLVYMTFKGEIPNGLQVNHINENKLDNRPENLNLMSPKDNLNWATHNERVAKALSKSVLQYDKSGNFIAEWPSTREAGRTLKIYNIGDCCLGKRNYAGGYIWKYKN